MQTDLRLLLLIVGLVYAVYTLFNTFTGRHKKAKSTEEEKFEQKISENRRGSKKSSKRVKKEHYVDVDNDPLLKDFEKNKSTEKAKKQQTLTPVAAVEDSNIFENNFDEEAPFKESIQPIIHPIPQQPSRQDPISYHQIISFSIVAKQQSGFSGKLLLSTLRANNFHFDNKIFHSHLNNNINEPIECSIACLVEPGIFDWQQIAHRSYPGLVIWIKLSGKQQDILLFEKLLTYAKQIASSLNAVLCDDARHPLSVQAISLYRARIKEKLSVAYI